MEWNSDIRKSLFVMKIGKSRKVDHLRRKVQFTIEYVSIPQLTCNPIFKYVRCLHWRFGRHRHNVFHWVLSGSHLSPLCTTPCSCRQFSVLLYKWFTKYMFITEISQSHNWFYTRWVVVSLCGYVLPSMNNALLPWACIGSFMCLQVLPARPCLYLESTKKTQNFNEIHLVKWFFLQNFSHVR